MPVAITEEVKVWHIDVASALRISILILLGYSPLHSPLVYKERNMHNMYYVISSYIKTDIQ